MATRPIPVFKWHGDLEIENEDDQDGQRLTAGMARLPAEALRDAFAQGQTVVGELYRDNGLGGYFLWIDIHGTEYKVFVNWTGIGGPHDDYFAIQGGRVRGCLTSLFGPPESDDELSEYAEVLAKALSRIAPIVELYWLTSDEFSACYCRGAPLPKTSA